MARVRNWWNWNHSKSVTLIWLICAIIFYSVFRLLLRNSYHTTRSIYSVATDFPNSNSERRLRLYDNLERDLEENGALFLKQGETSQSLSLSDLFTVKDGTVTPVLQAANPPVRANVLYLSTEHSVPISKAVKGIFLPYFDRAIWFQNSSMYHFSMFHASHHITPVPASEVEIETEANDVKAVAEVLCPLKIVLDRVVLTSTGVLLGCWQVLSGPDPITVRAKLKTALPRAPEKQLYDAAIFHTSFARLLGHPTTLPAEVDKTSEIHFFHQLVARLNNQIHGIQATVSELWYVEEYDLLALALNGRMQIRKYQLSCSKA
ncbi:unnamed protein product [Ilex paraguariensis]|uniref:Uncharacterized protein n=1 Tax=Ilex paraguariensis TaxID=185542 RepID=A0ABC8SNB0_9AQUA